MANNSNNLEDKLLRRAEIAKMSRKLTDCLALASYKNRHGFDRLSFSHVEAHYHDEVRKRTGGSSSVISTSSSSTSISDYPPYTRNARSSPLSARLFSDDQYFQSGPSSGPAKKRARFEDDYLGPTPKASRRGSKKKQIKSRNSKGNASWETQYKLPESSPLANRFYSDFRTPHGLNIPFTSIAPIEDEEEPTLPPTFHSSPPRTPPPTLPRGLRNHKSSMTNGEEGADLLLYLATSPSPAQPRGNNYRAFPPSTPPNAHAALPSSMLNTPGGFNMGGFNTTPGQNFNFSDFVNVTPSPAQGAFANRTPGLTKTPLAAKEARRKLNFDALVPPGGSPTLTRSSNKGLGMELGGDLRA